MSPLIYKVSFKGVPHIVFVPYLYSISIDKILLTNCVRVTKRMPLIIHNFKNPVLVNLFCSVAFCENLPISQQ